MSYKSDNPANKWHKQRQKQRHHGKSRDQRLHGEVINDDE